MILKFYYCNPTSPHKKVGNAILRFGQGTKFGHFAVGLETFSGEYVYEAVIPRYRKLRLDDWLTHYEVVKQIQWVVPPDMQFRVMSWLNKWVGTRYAVEQIILIGITLVLKLVDMALNMVNINGNKALVCTELGSRLAEKFWGFVPTESHDKFGLIDAEIIGDHYEHNAKWSLLSNPND